MTDSVLRRARRRGLQVDVTTFSHSTVPYSFLVVLAVAAVAKFAGTILGSVVSKMPISDATALGVVLNGRGATQVIIGSAGLSLGSGLGDLSRSRRVRRSGEARRHAAFPGHTVERFLVHVDSATVVVVAMSEVASVAADEQVDRSTG